MTSLAAVPKRPSSAPPASWQLESIVSQLRDVRNGHNREHAAERGVHELPSPDAIARIVESLRASLFPVHFGLPELTDQSIDYYVGHTLDGALRALAEQVRRCLQLPVTQSEELGSLDATETVRQFAAELPVILGFLECDIRAAYEGDPSANSLDEVMLCFPGIAAITYHRIAHALYRLKVPLLARIVSEFSHSSTGIDIHPGARIGKSFFID